MSINFYLVGGAVRDRLLGLEPKDLDYAVEAPSFSAMIREIENRGGKIFLESPEYGTVRAKLPELGTADYVLCRKDGYYSDGRRPDSVAPGTLMDDLKRRDFTINAMALDENGSLVDYFNGKNDLLYNKVIRCVGDAKDRFKEDSLRMLRALRFSIVKELRLYGDIDDIFYDHSFINLLDNVSKERIREELHKCFKFDTKTTIERLYEYPLLFDKIFNNKQLWLKPTFESK